MSDHYVAFSFSWVLLILHRSPRFDVRGIECVSVCTSKLLSLMRLDIVIAGARLNDKF